MVAAPGECHCMQITKKEAHKIFNKLELEIRSSGHNYGWLVYNKKKILRVHYSHGKGDLPGRVTDRVRSQLRLPPKDFKDLISCTLTREEYLKILIEKGLI